MANGASLALLAVEAIGALSMWAPIPLAWMWIGARVYDATGSLVADGSVVLLGFLATIVLAMKALARVDMAWVALRRRAGHDQTEGALSQVVIAVATLGLLAFLVWYYIIDRAFVLPFMPNS